MYLRPAGFAGLVQSSPGYGALIVPMVCGDRYYLLGVGVRRISYYLYLLCSLLCSLAYVKMHLREKLKSRWNEKTAVPGI